MCETALIVEVTEAEAATSAWRLCHDPVAARGVPGHITALFPFVPPEMFDDAVLDSVAVVAQETPAFDFELVAVDEFPGAVWLRPHPEDPFRDLTRRLWASFPDYPPYGGRHPVSRPHLTLAIAGDGEDQAELADRIRADLGPRLPLRCTATAISVFMSDRDGVFHRAHRLELSG